jgi:hypothetical protein
LRMATPNSGPGDKCPISGTSRPRSGLPQPSGAPHCCTVPPQDYTREFESNGQHWRVYQQPPVWAGAVPRGGVVPHSPRAGLVFVSESRERRFLPRTYPFELLTDEELAALPEEQLIEYLERAEREH